MYKLLTSLVVLALPAMVHTAYSQVDYGLRDSTFAPGDYKKSTDSSLTQHWTSEAFGYSLSLPEEARYNKIGSKVNVAGQTERINFMLRGGNGSVTVYHFAESRWLPATYSLLDSVAFYQFDSTGRNGTIYRRVYIMREQAIQIDILLTERGEENFGTLVKPIFDSFVPASDMVLALKDYQIKARDPKEYEQGRYGEGFGPDR